MAAQQPRRPRAAHAVKPLTMWAYRRITRSSQPQRRFLPVVTPHSWPRLCSRSPISCVRGGAACELMRVSGRVRVSVLCACELVCERAHMRVSGGVCV